MRDGDTLEERLHRERGDEPADPNRSGRLAMEGEGAALETPDAMDAADVGLNGGAASAEEAAVHVVEDTGASPAGRQRMNVRRAARQLAGRRPVDRRWAASRQVGTSPAEAPTRLGRKIPPASTRHGGPTPTAKGASYFDLKK